MKRKEFFKNKCSGLLFHQLSQMRISNRHEHNQQQLFFPVVTFDPEATSTYHMKRNNRSSYKLIKFWKKIGPGLVTGASDDDPSGIATYSQAGAAFGLATLWTSIVAFPLMAIIQQMCARIGLVTSQGLTGTLKKHYPRPVLWYHVAV
jgi:hypothetical protein